jgi:hypothetical protein
MRWLLRHEPAFNEIALREFAEVLWPFHET